MKHAEKTWKQGRFLLLTLGLVLAAASVVHAAPAYYNKPYLTWQGDTSTTMTIVYHSEAAPASVEAVYDTTSKPESYAASAQGASWQIPNLEDGRYINAVELTGLTPGKDYYFRLKLADGLSDEYTFRTIPEGQDTLRFVVCGDTLASPIFRDLVEKAATWNPQFFVVGGDLAYANGDVKQIQAWNNWLSVWARCGVTAEGRLIPLVMAIGNHETNKLEGVSREERAPFYFGFFPQGGKTYFSRRFGQNLGMTILDSNHLAPHEEQIGFLEEQLKAHASLAFSVAVYHVPLYPSHRDFNGSSSAAGRTHWLPLFDAHDLDVGFEHHDHIFKRTKRLRNNEVNPVGTLYVGDGNAGVRPRTTNEGLWYIEKSTTDSHVWVVDATNVEMHLRAVDRKGNVFDEARIERR